jgi:hypothetical protein
VSFSISETSVARELVLIAVFVASVGLYLFVSMRTSKRKNNRVSATRTQIPETGEPKAEWDDLQPLFWRHSLNTLAFELYYISAFTAELLQKSSQNKNQISSETKICVSRSAGDTEKLIHPLQKKIESRLRRSDIRPRPRLKTERTSLPFPLFSATRPDAELSTYVLNFLDACIDLSVSCDTLVNFTLELDQSGVSIAAVWKKNQLIADATAQIELLDNMRLTMSGDTVLWEFLIFSCPQGAGELNDDRSALSVAV